MPSAARVSEEGLSLFGFTERQTYRISMGGGVDLIEAKAIGNQQIKGSELGLTIIPCSPRESIAPPLAPGLVPAETFCLRRKVSAVLRSTKTSMICTIHYCEDDMFLTKNVRGLLETRMDHKERQTVNGKCAWDNNFCTINSTGPD